MTHLDNLKDGITKQIDEINNRSFENLFLEGGNIAKWQNMEGGEIRVMVDSVFDTLNKLKDNIKILDKAGVNIVNSISNNLTNFLNQYNQISSLKSEQISSQHHNSLNQVQAIGNSLRQYGLYSELKTEIDIEAKSTALNNLLTKSDDILDKANNVLDVSKEASLKENSDRLSKAFNKRASDICKEKEKWEKKFNMYYILVMVISFVFGIFFFGSFIVGASNLWVVVLRIFGLLVLIPLYVFLYITHNRFKHERDIEEIYEHKSVISSVLPSYHSMLNDESIKDKMITSVSDMIIKIPESDNKKIITGGNKKKDDVLSDIERITKIIKSVKE